MSLDWKPCYTNQAGSLILIISTTQPDPTLRHWCLIQVFDNSFATPQKLFEAFLPKLLEDQSLESLKLPMSQNKIERIIQLLEVILLYTPALFKNQITLEEIKAQTRPRWHRLIQLLITRYYAILKYEHGYDAGIPCTVYDNELLDPILFPKLHSPETFENTNNLLSYSHGKESQMCRLVLDQLEIKYDTFAILDRADAPLLEIQEADEWQAAFPGYQCYLGDVRRLWWLQNHSRLVARYEDLETTPTSYNELGQSIGWALGLVQRGLALLYAAAFDYQQIFVGENVNGTLLIGSRGDYIFHMIFIKLNSFSTILPEPLTCHINLLLQ